MNPNRWVAAGAVWALVAVALGAFAAHGLHDRLVEADALENWRTAVRYQMWHALALVLLGLAMPRLGAGGVAGIGNGVGWLFLVGSLLFSGSLYGLCLDGPAAVLGPVTPIGGLLMMVGWLLFALRAWRAAHPREA